MIEPVADKDAARSTTLLPNRIAATGRDRMLGQLMRNATEVSARDVLATGCAAAPFTILPPVQIDQHGLLATPGASIAAGRCATSRRDAFFAHPAMRPDDVVALAQAIARNELFLDWQACHDIRSGAVLGYEALVRWRHPASGVLGPDRFVPMAETCGLSARLDRWVLLHACAEAALGGGDAYYSVNISAQRLSSGAIVPMVRAALAQSGLRPCQLVLEITETTPITDPARAIASMEQLRALGVQFALDDFGTGYSALSYLQCYPFDVVKLDRAFVAAIGTSLRGLRLAKGVMQLAQGLDLDVVAEGIETQAEADLLTQAGCTHGQGFLWGRPQPAPWLVQSAGLPVATGG